MPAAWIGAAAAVAGTVGSMVGGGGSSSVPQAYNFQNTGSADSTYGSMMGANSSAASAGQQYTNGITSNPYASGYVGAATQAGTQYGTLGQQAGSASSGLYSAGASTLPYASSILQAGFDPQNQLYAQSLNNEQQQTGAQLAATGVGATPYGASVMGQNNTNFNIDWQNNQLSRETQAASGASSILNSAEGAYNAGASQGQTGAAATLSSGSVPYGVSTGIDQTSLQALQTQQGLNSTAMSGAGSYLGMAAGTGYGDQMSQYNAQNTANQQMYAGIGTLGGAVGNAYNNGSLGNLLGGYGSSQQIGSATFNSGLNYVTPTMSSDY